MFIRKNKNRSGSVSIQIISKASGKYQLIKTIGSGRSEQEIERLLHQAKIELSGLRGQPSLFISQRDSLIEGFVSTLENGQVRIAGPELVYGILYERIGYSIIEFPLFRHLVISRLVYPGSKLKTIDYLYRYQGVELKVDKLYRFMDKLKDGLKEQIEQIAFDYTRRILGGKIGIVFYDMTTVYFEAGTEDDFRKTGFSKEGKHQNPQIYVGLLVGQGGYPIAYELFEGDIYEGHTLIPVLENLQQRFGIDKPIIIADAGLLSNDNIKNLVVRGYRYILGARIKNESTVIKNKILDKSWNDGKLVEITQIKNKRLIVGYSEQRAKKDVFNRKRGLKRLEKQLKSGKLTKSHINKRGYNKYLQIKGEVTISIDYEKFEKDDCWDGLKGYLTNTDLKPNEVVEAYNELWQIERAFRISKTDLKVRPIYHRLRHRIEAHFCIAFSAYTIYKELERVLRKAKASFSAKRAAELALNMYQISITLPDSKEQKNILLKTDKNQQELIEIIQNS